MSRQGTSVSSMRWSPDQNSCRSTLHNTGFVLGAVACAVLFYMGSQGSFSLYASPVVSQPSSGAYISGGRQAGTWLTPGSIPHRADLQMPRHILQQGSIPHDQSFSYPSYQGPQSWVAIGLVSIALSAATSLLQLYTKWVLNHKSSKGPLAPLWSKVRHGSGAKELLMASTAALEYDDLDEEESSDVQECASAPSLLVLSALEDLLIGAVAGIVKIMLAMPLLTWKFKVQAGAPLPTTIAEWYRGAFVQAAAVTPIASLQMVANGTFSKLISGASPFSDTLKRELSNPERMLAALGAGVLSALIYTPVDLLTIQQQQLGSGLSEAFKFIVQHCGIFGLMRGALAMSIREGIFTLGMLGLTPILSEWFAKKFAALRNNQFLCNVAGAICAGVTAALLTHPMDTIKTQIQIDLTGQMYTNIFTTTSLLIQNEGWGYLFIGTVPRTMMICISFFVAASLRQAYLTMKVGSMEVESA